MPISPSYLELCVNFSLDKKIEYSIYLVNMLHLICDSILSMYCQCCYSVCKPDIDLVRDVHPVERPARADRDADRAEKDLLVRIETPSALRAVGVLIRTCRSFYWMNIADKVDILYIPCAGFVQV